MRAIPAKDIDRGSALTGLNNGEASFLQHLGDSLAKRLFIFHEEHFCIGDWAYRRHLDLRFSGFARHNQHAANSYRRETTTAIAPARILAPIDSTKYLHRRVR